ncbi:hypothetical protein BBBOND_0314000 [Babesia bigemina]|uniref:C3H1-type domain-containing protein n=1 Tax=Babesia bigemina TaxID=5866 RepID=A0A061DAC3_BABBI|nr:hypothetical protein BBBOND_0314000 [Babesia bigemina]CDR97498.1 hypothetical protein BBBOND_0314000 [Babesia bigemina]|eukprot:XP_012769684.1 hypothetical protein BBBOND_0314000 [Babesia bigemina]
MAFLHRVLGAVKDDEAVKKYNEYMPVNNKLEKVLEEVNKNIGSGRAGLAASVGAVREWLEGYEGEVKEKNGMVVGPLKILDKDISVVLNAIKRKNASPYSDEVLKSWMEEVKKLPQKSAESLEKLSKIDKNLRTQIEPNVKVIDQAVKDLARSAELDHKGLEKVAKDTDAEIRALESVVKQVATREEKKCIGELQENFGMNIIAPMEQVKNQLETINENLERWIREVAKVVEAAIKKCDEILQRVDKKTGGGDAEILEKTRLLKYKSLTLLAAATLAKEKVQNLVPHALEQVKQMDDALKNDLYKVKDAVQEKVTGIKEAIGKLYKVVDITNSLSDSERKKKIATVLGYIYGQLNEIKGHVGESKKRGENKPNDKSIYYNWCEVKDKIEDYVAKIKGVPGEGLLHNKDGLKQIVDGIKDYATGFKSLLEGSIVATVTAVVDSDVMQKGYLLWYARDNKQNFQGPSSIQHAARGVTQEDLLKKITPLVKKTITEEMKSYVDTVRITDYDDPEHMLTAISRCLTTCSAKVEGQENKIVSLIETAMMSNDELRLTMSTTYPNKYQPYNLNCAVKTIVYAVSHLAKDADTELKSFISASHIINLKTAIVNADNINAQFRSGGTSYGSKIDTSLKEVHTQIETLHHQLQTATQAGSDGDASNTAAADVDTAIEWVTNTLDAEIGTTTDKTVQLPDRADKFGGYKNFVNQDSTKLTGDAGKLEGALPQKIKDIGDEIKKALNIIAPSPSVGEQIKQQTFDEPFTKIAEELREITALVKKSNSFMGDDKADKGVLALLRDLGMGLNRGLAGVFSNGLKDIEKHLENIIGHEDDTTEMPTTVYGIINACRKFYELMRTKINTCISTITDSLATHVKLRIAAIRNSALSQFAQSKAAALQKLQELVERENAAIKKIIEEDLESGLKGMMGKMKDNQTFLDTLQTQTELRTATPQVRMFVDVLLQYVESEVQTSTGQTKKDTVASTKIADVKAMLGLLLDDLSSSNHFDHTFSRNLADFTNTLSALQPSTFAGHNHPELPDAMRGGLRKLVGELGRAYVSRYDGSPAITDWLLKDPKQQSAQKVQDSDQNMILTTNGNNCAKVFLTCVTSYVDELHHLFYHGGKTWKEHFVAGTDTGNQNTNMLRDYLTIHGYGIESLKKTYTGKEVAFRLSRGFTRHKTFNKDPSELNSVGECFEYFKEKGGILAQLFTHLHHYYEVCHYGTMFATKQPSSVYQMLLWLSGFPYNPVYQPLSFNGFSELFEKEENNAANSEGDDILLETDDADTLPAHPENITVGGISGMLTEVCHQAHDVLTSILGHGHADGIYAVDFNTNSQGFSYPSRYGQCIDMLVDILNRLYQQLYFVCCQCCNDESCSGWRGCLYGNAIGGSDWKCNSKQCADQKCNQKVNQTCELHPKCGVKSPLQSYLEDGLPGFLPHSFKKPGCKLECTVSNHRGIPCKTPMGFTDISTMASHTQIGEHLRKVLAEFCGKQGSPLTKLCGYFNCLLQTPPQTLGDMFAFYYNFTNRWSMGNSEHREAAFNTAVNNANFGVNYEELKVYYIFSFSHSEAWTGHSAGSLGSLVCTSNDAVVCGPYLRPINKSIYGMFSSKHADKYLSWIVYLTATFYDLLKKLYDECNSKCGFKGSNCHEKACIKECTTTSTTYKPPRYHDPKCKSIVKCNSTLPTLAKYGFVLGDPERLNRDGQSHTKRTCRDFCDVFAEAFDKDSHLVQFFKAIDNFMFTIRAPFLWMTVALWSLSFFYLICVMVGRLDVLHIRSHLRIPSSHKITAQSLLAAAQVGRLAKISYLQP